MHRDRRLLPGLSLFLLFACGLSLRADSLMVTGVGSPGTWTTELEMANPTPEPVVVQVFLDAAFFDCPPFPVCVPSHLAIPPNGTKSLSLSDTLFNSTTSLTTVFITPLNPGALPVVSARAVNSVDPNQSVALPVIRLSTLSALAPTVLIFPGAKRSETLHSNIVVGAVAPDGTSSLFSIQVDVYSADGTFLAGGAFADTFADFEGGGANIFLVDVLHTLGIQNLDAGQIRVTKLSGDGALWGEMATLGTGNSVVIAQGINL